VTSLLDIILRARLRAQLYFGIGGAVAITLLATVVAWVSFDRVADAQRRVNEGAVPDMAAAFGIAQQADAVATAAPRLTVAESLDELGEVVEEINREMETFLSRVDSLPQEGTEVVRARGGALTANLDSIEASAAIRFQLADRSQALRDSLRAVEAELNAILVTAIDDQYFYAMTGYSSLDSGPAPRDEYFTAGQINRYRRLAELQEASAIGTQVLANAFSLTDRAQLEPLRERFETSAERIQRNLAALGAAPEVAQLHPLFDELVGLGTQAESIFDVRENELRLSDLQSNLLADNRATATALVSEVEGLVSSARESALQATQASQHAILTGRQYLLALNVVTAIGAVLIGWLFVGKVLLRRLEQMSGWMRRMAAGDLETKVEVRGRDEVADMAAALEVFRKHALEVQRLNLVEKLAEELKGKNSELEHVLEELRAAQNQIVMREKLAALGELTAGVAHEIKNPLNFVKNFSEVSAELLEELQELLPQDGDAMNTDEREEVAEICQDLTGNLESIQQHGARANRIVHDMLRMGGGAGDKAPTDINLLVREHANLAYHSARATDSEFQLTIEEGLDPSLGEIEVVSQDLGRVVLNMVSNACYATDEKRRQGARDYEPTLRIETQETDGRVLIRIRDNGNGMPQEVIDKIFNPFFTTKPTNKGTGLGLSLSNDIVREHGGKIRVESKPGEYTEMTIDLPVTAPSIAVPA